MKSWSQGRPERAELIKRDILSLYAGISTHIVPCPMRTFFSSSPLGPQAGLTTADQAHHACRWVRAYACVGCLSTMAACQRPGELNWKRRQPASDIRFQAACFRRSPNCWTDVHFSGSLLSRRNVYM